MKKYKPTIGIEVHAELKTNTKMFCNSENAPHAAEPNSNICPVCMAHPGTLPVINKEAVKHVVTVGVAVGGSIATYTEFDRKNYFYPDIPKGYQISQYEHPLVSGGELAGVKLTRIHLEEDTARSLHDQGTGSIIDYNRAGVPLMELVTEPVVHDAETAGRFCRELQTLLRTLGVSDANMEKGEMRVEANISISDTDEFGTKVEVKNLNSFKAMESAIAYEIKRQASVLDRGEQVIQETRGWDENKAHTFAQRKKETADDYRYFPDPDLPSLDLRLEKDFEVSRIEENLPELPQNKRDKYKDLGLAGNQIEIFVTDPELSTALETVTANADVAYAKLAANYLVTDVQPLRSEQSGKTINPETFAELITMIQNGDITSRVAKDIISEVTFDGVSPQKIAEERGLLQDNSEETIKAMVEQIVAENETVVAEYKSGKEPALKFLVGQGMKASKGAANPQMLESMLKDAIS